MLSDERLIQLMEAAPECCQERTEVYSRVCGFFRPVQQWNKGKREEFRQRKEYKP